MGKVAKTIRMTGPGVRRGMYPSGGLSSVDGVLSITGSLKFGGTVAVVLKLNRALSSMSCVVSCVESRGVSHIVFCSLGPRGRAVCTGSSRPTSLCCTRIMTRIELTFPSVRVVYKA